MIYQLFLQWRGLGNIKERRAFRRPTAGARLQNICSKYFYIYSWFPLVFSLGRPMLVGMAVGVNGYPYPIEAFVRKKPVSQISTTKEPVKMTAWQPRHCLFWKSATPGANMVIELSQSGLSKPIGCEWKGLIGCRHWHFHQPWTSEI